MVNSTLLVIVIPLVIVAVFELFLILICGIFIVFISVIFFCIHTKPIFAILGATYPNAGRYTFTNYAIYNQESGITFQRALPQIKNYNLTVSTSFQNETEILMTNSFLKVIILIFYLKIDFLQLSVSNYTQFRFESRNLTFGTNLQHKSGVEASIIVKFHNQSVFLGLDQIKVPLFSSVGVVSDICVIANLETRKLTQSTGCSIQETDNGYSRGAYSERNYYYFLTFIRWT
jgi:hypothetical protein